MAWTLGLGRNQVFADGQVMIEARYPNQPAPGLEMYVADLSPLWPTFGEFSIPEPVSEPGRVTSKLLDGQPADYWKGAIYYGVHFEGWCGQTGVIESSKPGEIRVGDRTNGWWFAGPYHGRLQARGRTRHDRRPHERPGPAGRVALAGEHALFHSAEREPSRRRGGQTPATGLRPQRARAHPHRGARGRGGLDAAGGFGLVRRGPLPAVVHLALHPPVRYGPGRAGTRHDQVGRDGIFVGGHDNAFLNSSIRFSAGPAFICAAIITRSTTA